MNRAWFSQLFFSVVEHGSIRALDALISIVLIGSLGSAKFGMFSVYQSWIAVALLFFPGIELSLFREYGKLKASGELSLRLNVIRFYNYIKILLALLFSFALAASEGWGLYSERFLLLFFAFALPLSHSVYGYMRDPLRFEMQQSRVAAISAVQRLVFAGVMGGLGFYFHDNIPVIVCGSLTVYILFYFLWKAAAIRLEKSSLSAEVFKKTVFDQLSGTTLWIHLNGIIFSVVQTLDVLLLNQAGIAVEEIGRYSIALKTASFFQMIPIAIVSSFGVYLGIKSSESDNHMKEKATIWKMTFIFALLCIVMFYIGSLFGSEIIQLIGRGKFEGDDLKRCIGYFIPLLIGILILCCSHPLSTYLGARSELKKITGFVIIPWMVVSFFIYKWAISMGRPMLVAIANIYVYAVLFLFLLVFYIMTVKRETPRQS